MCTKEVHDCYKNEETLSLKKKGSRRKHWEAAGVELV